MLPFKKSNVVELRPVVETDDGVYALARKVGIRREYAYFAVLVAFSVVVAVTA